MNVYETLKKALEERIALTVEVLLKNGEIRVRNTVVVAALTHSTVTFFETGKGFRSAPVGLVRKLRLEPEQEAVAHNLYAFLDGPETV